MFSALSQGSLVYILDKTDSPTLKLGEVISISLPKPSVTQYQQLVVDMKINIGGNTYEYNSIPSSLSLVTYNNGKIVISETKQGLQQEVENILANSKQIVSNVEQYKRNIVECEAILKDLNPQFAIDKERDDRLTNLESKLDKLLTIIGSEAKV